MLLEEIQKCIEDMDELRRLEQASKDSQKQDKTDTRYAEMVEENHKVVVSIEERRKYVRFIPSSELKEEMIRTVTNSREAVNTGLIQEIKIRELQNDTKYVKERFLSEWKVFFKGLSEKRINTLTTVKGITPDRDKTGYAINKIKNAAVINYNDIDKVRLLAAGVLEADQILEGLGLNDEIMNFLDKVSEGNATLLDLSDNLVKWINSENLSDKFTIAFKG